MAALVPDLQLSARDLFKIDTDLMVPAFSVQDEHVPTFDADYVFDRDTTLALLAGFLHNRRVLVQGRHGTGKSSHIEQVAARLNWPCVRVNLDGHVTRMDLIGKDTIAVRDGKQVTEFQPGMLTWALQRPCALVFDEYDAGRADVMFVIQRVLELEGRLTLLDQGRVIQPHPYFRLFATANTIGLGDATGLYHGTQPLNQGQMDRWSIVVMLNYLEHDREVDVVLARCPEYRTPDGRAIRKCGGSAERSIFSSWLVTTVGEPSKGGARLPPNESGGLARPESRASTTMKRCDQPAEPSLRWLGLLLFIRFRFSVRTRWAPALGPRRATARHRSRGCRSPRG